MKTLYLDCFSGISGDMLVGTLIDLGADVERLRTALASLQVQGFDITAEKSLKKGITATQFRVVQDNTDKPHRHLRHILEIIERGDLPASVKEASVATFRRIAECEAAIHGTTVEKIHFHEVGAIDSIVDVVAAHLALHLLEVGRVVASAVNTGSGTVQCAHGLMPVPAPATAQLLQGVPSYGSDCPYELTTPTGAALVAQMADAFAPMPVMVVEKVGYGSGTRDLPDHPNVLRGILGTETATGQREPITVVETNIDDLLPELMPPLIDALLLAGAREAFLTPLYGKKGRPAFLVTALCDQDKLAPVTDAFFEHSSTLGIRMRTEERLCLDREWETVATPWGEVRMKIGIWNGKVRNRAPEFEDCRKVAEAAGISVMAVYQAALAAKHKEV
jgi:hypothetical protein